MRTASATTSRQFCCVLLSRSLKKGKATDWPVRVAVTGRLSGPPLFESLELLGREATLRRMATLVEATPA